MFHWILLQDTAAVLLSAALASRNIESFTPGNLEELEKGSSSTGETPSSSGGGKSDQVHFFPFLA